MLEEMDPTLALMAGTKGKEATLEARVADKEREALFRMRIQVKTSIASCIVDDEVRREGMTQQQLDEGRTTRRKRAQDSHGNGIKARRQAR